MTQTKTAEQHAFDEFIFRFDTEITVPTAARLAQEIGVTFYPENYDH